MKKIVPDPPLSESTTASKSFCTCEESHPPLFNVAAGTSAEDALVHASNLLQGIHDTLERYSQQIASEKDRGILWSAQHSAESARALVDGLIDGLTA